MYKLKARVLLFQENNIWIAQCLEHNFATQGKKAQDAIDALERTILGQVVLDVQDGIEPLSDIAPAPKSCFELYEQVSRFQDIRTLQLPISYEKE